MESSKLFSTKEDTLELKKHEEAMTNRHVVDHVLRAVLESSLEELEAGQTLYEDSLVPEMFVDPVGNHQVRVEASHVSKESHVFGVIGERRSSKPVGLSSSWWASDRRLVVNNVMEETRRESVSSSGVSSFTSSSLNFSPDSHASSASFDLDLSNELNDSNPGFDYRNVSKTELRDLDASLPCTPKTPCLLDKLIMAERWLITRGLNDDLLWDRVALRQ